MTPHPARGAGDPLRQGHRQLLSLVGELQGTLVALRDPSVPATSWRLPRLVGALQDVLLARVWAEEAVLHPELEPGAGSPAISAMEHDHEAAVTGVDRLAATVTELGGRRPERSEIDRLSRELAALEATFRRHFDREERLALPVLERTLSPERAAVLWAGLAEAGAGAGGFEPAVDEIAPTK